MIRILIILMAFICMPTFGQSDLYKIKRIKRVRGYYVIYVTKSDQSYKIVSKKEKEKKGVKVQKGCSYSLAIERVKSFGGNEVDCFTFGKNEICKEPDMDLYIAKNMNGLFVH